MPVRKGYKQTEIGVIPEDWEIRNLGDIGQLSTGSGLLKGEFSSSGDIPAIPYTSLYTDYSETVDYDSIKWFVDDYRKTTLVNFPCVLIASSSNMEINTGKASALTKSIPVAIGREVIIFKSSSDCAFISYLLSTESYRKRTLTLARGTTIKHVYTATFRDYPIAHPTLAEQEAIAEALSDADGLIKSLEDLISKKRLVKQGAMQKLLTGKKRLPGFEGEWEEKRFGDLLAEPPSYGINAPAVKKQGNLPLYLRITDIDDDGRFLTHGRVGVDHPLWRNYLLGKNQIVFARTGASVGKTYLYNPEEGEVVFAGFLIRAKIDTSLLNPDFFFNFTRTTEYWSWVKVMSMRSGQPGINGYEFASLEIKIPPTVEEQNAIAEILIEMDNEIAALETRLAKARRIKEGMMQELLTGRIRLI